MPESHKRTAITTLRRDVNTEYLALSRATREALERFARRIHRLERAVSILAVLGLLEGGVVAFLLLR